MVSRPEVISYLLDESGDFPNNSLLPLVIVKQVYTSGVKPQHFEDPFNRNNWPAAWRNGLYDFHHYHSKAHEALGIYRGWVEGCFGGPGGVTVRAEAGDVIIIPAGVSHCNFGQSADFSVVGAYPEGQRWDMCYGRPGERPTADESIRKVALPVTDPLFGDSGPLLKLWGIAHH